MLEKLERIRAELAGELETVSVPEAVERLRVRFLGKKGELTSILREMGSLSAEERPRAGAKANELRQWIEKALENAAERVGRIVQEQRLRAETLDITLPGRMPSGGHRHPLKTVLAETCELFTAMGFSIVEGPEVETDYYVFTALNTDENHPARDEQDTFYINDHLLLRTQTSSVQIRVMEKTKPPIRIISPGRVYRKDELDSTHSPLFHQIEGLVVDKGITMADLKGTLEELVRGIFGKDARIRFRPHHFPYTEPSAEVDLQCFNCGGTGCGVCKGEGWIELLGSGMVHPKVLAGCGIDPEIYSGFAFGVGLERLTLGRYSIPDLRLMFENDVRFLRQFS